MKIDGFEVHPTVTAARVSGGMMRRITTLDNPGYCLSCGIEQDGCEPDARGYECEACGEPAVYGADELFMEMA